jgi:hypothetical protein
MIEQGGNEMLKKLSVISILIMAIFMAGQLPIYAGDVLNAAGKVKDVDLDEKSIVLGIEDGDKVFYLDSNSQIKMGKENKQLKDVGIGMVLEVKYQKSGDDNIVKVINIVS